MTTPDYQQPTDVDQGSSCDTSETCCPMRGGGKSLLIGILVLVGVFVLVEHQRSVPPASPVSTAITWVKDYNAAISQAVEKNQPMLLAFEASWCAPCRWMDREVFSMPTVGKALSNWVSMQIDVDKNPDLARKYQVEAMPTFVVLTPAGKEVDRATGALPSTEFVSFLASAQAKMPNASSTK